MLFKAGREMRQGAEACHICYLGDIVLPFDNQFGSPVEFIRLEENVGIHACQTFHLIIELSTADMHHLCYFRNIQFRIG